jgi:5-hydroxyisourate hydrolase
MATVSTHLLDSVTGTHAAGVRSQLFRLDGDAGRRLLFDVATDNEGRIVEKVEIGDDTNAEFELVFHARDYFVARGQGGDSPLNCVVIRFVMQDDARRYHLPVMLAPHSYSTWWSG